MTKITNKEFLALARTNDNDIIELSEVGYKLTDSQIERLSEDDWSRIQENKEEMRCMMSDLRAEFG